MELKLQDSEKLNFQGDRTFVLPHFAGEKIGPQNEKIRKEFDKFSAVLNSVKENEIRFFVLADKKVIALNLGEKEKWNQRKFLLTLRKICRFLKENKCVKATIFLENVIPKDSDFLNLTRQLSENILLADYEFLTYKEKPKEGFTEIKSIEIVWPEPKKHQKILDEGIIIGESVNFARKLSNTPGGEMTPEKLALEAESSVKELKKIQIEIFDEKKLKELKMGGILGVSQGSIEKPKLIILKYFGKAKSKGMDLAFVGKGITFDTGGLHIKPADAMLGMHLDMSGGAAVLAAVIAISKLKLPLNVVALVPAVENMPSGQSYRPGDILKSYSGKTIEVINTDAEGRIVLADALFYAFKSFEPKLMIDIATLTGSSMAALGQRATALFSNQPKLESVFRQIGEDSGDYVWPLPLWEEYEEEIKGTFGDIANVGSNKYGGAITAALFLKNFIGNLPWIHLDIAPTMISIEGQGLAKGATGVGVRYLVKLAKDFPEIEKSL